MAANVTDLISQLNSISIPEGDPQCEQLKNGLLGLYRRLESPQDVMMKLIGQRLEISLIRVGVELRLFNHLADHDTDIHSVNSLAKVSGASPGLLVRMFRMLSASHIVDEVGPRQYRANKMTRILADDMVQSMAIHSYDLHGPSAQCLPDFLIENKYQDITTKTGTPFQKAFNTELTCFDWLSQRPRQFAALQKLMMALTTSDWVENFETLHDVVTAYIEDKSSVEDSEVHKPRVPLFVDVGGGYGHQCASLCDKFPELSKMRGSMVVQDLPQAVQNVKIAGVEAMAHDFFAAQPVKGAHIYYLRNVLHDWADQSCVEILSHLVAAMAPESMIMIDEVCLPATGAPRYAALADLTMMITFGAKERGREDWETMGQAVGLKIKEVHTYQGERARAVMVLVRE